MTIPDACFDCDAQASSWATLTDKGFFASATWLTKSLVFYLLGTKSVSLGGQEFGYLLCCNGDTNSSCRWEEEWEGGTGSHFPPLTSDTRTVWQESPILVKSGRKHQKTMRARASCLAQGLEQSLVGEALGQVLGTDHRGAQETNSR